MYTSHIFIYYMYTHDIYIINIYIYINISDTCYGHYRCFPIQEGPNIKR